MRKQYAIVPEQHYQASVHKRGSKATQERRQLKNLTLFGYDSITTKKDGFHLSRFDMKHFDWLQHVMMTSAKMSPRNESFYDEERTIRKRGRALDVRSHHGKGVCSMRTSLLCHIGMVVEASSLERLLSKIITDFHSDRRRRAFHKTWRARKRSLRPCLAWCECQW